MTIQYNIYSNDGAGGPVDYSAPVATTSSLTWTSPYLDMPSETTFAVRATDTASGLEEQNVDARVTVSVDEEGSDITGLPAAPRGLTATPGANGTYTVSWGFALAGRPKPSQFRVYLGTPAVDYSAPVATVAYVPGHRPYRVALAGLTGGTTYRVAVRAENATGEEKNTVTVAVAGLVAGPLAVEALSAVAF